MGGRLVRSEEAQRLLVGIHDATRGLQDPAIVMREIVTRVGLHFDVTALRRTARSTPTSGRSP